MSSNESDSLLFKVLKIGAIVLLMPVVVPMVLAASKLQKLRIQQKEEEEREKEKERTRVPVMAGECHKCEITDPGPSGWWSDSEDRSTLYCQKCFESLCNE